MIEDGGLYASTFPLLFRMLVSYGIIPSKTICRELPMSCSCNQHREHGAYNCIGRVPIFSQLTSEEMLEVASITTDRTYGKGELIYSAGERKGDLYVLHTGQVKVYRLSSDGKEQVIRTLGPGEFLGELSLFSQSPLTDYAQALESSTMCMIQGSLLKQLMVAHPSIAFKVMEELSHRLETSESLIQDINLSSVEQRLARFLLAAAHEASHITLKISKGDLASQLGMSQETLSRKLSIFQENGLITLHGQRGIGIVDRNGLESLLEE
jgi:CRP/FNR family transcriptional regulator